MKVSDIRSQFLKYFTDRGHELVPSYNLVPANDPTLFFVNAGMVQFKDVFTGADVRSYSRATSVQKCLRVSGKHNDLENVGRTPRHHTFFEMLGNFSFGDYFKKDAIHYGWELLGQLGVPMDRLWVTVYEEDDEALDLWASVPGVRRDRIQKLGAKDNFWAMGDTGPCGPCSEIFYDHGADLGPDGGPATDSDRYVEVWNLVFMQFERSADGTMAPLPRPSIDTGMGIERIGAVLQGVRSNYDTDAFTPIMARAAKVAGVPVDVTGEQGVALRVIADHARAAAFLVGDGVMPSNEERGYVLRRVMRRAIRFGVKLGLDKPFLHEACDAVVEHMGDAYPELSARADFIREVVKGEEERFRMTLDRGLGLLDAELERLQPGQPLAGDVAFKLYDTYGFPLDLTQLIAQERQLTVDEDGYDQAMAAQKAAGRSAWKGSGEQALAEVWQQLRAEGVAAAFTGYDNDLDRGRVVALVKDGRPTHELHAGEKGQLVLDRTPFYGESGGQVGDTGTLTGLSCRLVVEDATRPLAGLVAHSVQVRSGTVKVGDELTAMVDHSRRNLTRKNHTATHLLHAALRKVLGTHVQQKGSAVDPDRLRFDFSHHKAVTAEELCAVEDLVYANILDNTALHIDEMDMDAARARGAMALFGEKYGDRVRVVDVPGFSVELCGGTHVSRTGDIGLFRITSESAVAAGVRRIEALTGPGAFSWARARDVHASAAASCLKIPPEQLPAAIEKLQADKKALQKELDALRAEIAKAAAGDLLSQARDVGGIQVLAAELQGDPKTLREEADRLRDKLGSAVVVLGTRAGGNVQIVATVSKDLAGKRVHAGNLVRDVAKLVGGGGGGRPDMAQAGGKDADALPAALQAVYGMVGA